MFCSECGKQMADDAKFCQSCGAKAGGGAAGAAVHRRDRDADSRSADQFYRSKMTARAEKFLNWYHRFRRPKK